MLKKLTRKLLIEDAIEDEKKTFVDSVASASKLSDSLHIANCDDDMCCDNDKLCNLLKSIDLDTIPTGDCKSEELYKQVKEALYPSKV